MDELDSEEEQDLNNGAILVHSLVNGKPNLDKFMEQLEEAMARSEDPLFMKQISKRYRASRKSKIYSKPPPRDSIASFKGSIRRNSAEITSTQAHPDQTILQ